MRICIFGDSVSFGMMDTSKGGWVDRLKLYLLRFCNSLEGKFLEVYNLGTPGDSSKELLDYIENELDARLGMEEKYKRKNIIILAIGVNDSYLFRNERMNTLPEQFKKNIIKLINISKKFSNKIILIGITPVVESLTNPIPWNANCYHKNKHIEQYNKILESVSIEENVYFIDIYNEWIKMNYKKLLYDGLHPNFIGHKKIFEKVKKFLIDNKMVEIK